MARIIRGTNIDVTVIRRLKVKHNILLIDDDLRVLASTKAFLEQEGFFVKAVQNSDEGIALVRQNTIPFSLALIDFHMPGATGSEVIKKIREYNSNLTLLAFSGDDSTEVHNQTLDSGAIFFVLKDTPNAKLLGIIFRICQEVERKIKPLKIIDESENRKLIESVGMIGVSNHLADIAKQIIKYAPSLESVLICGENGTGKEKIAQALHKMSSRCHMPFIAVNCGAISKDIIESELFGHEKGSFTGASASKIGKFQAANGGTLFLDEIGEMPLSLQATLLRVLQEKTIMPVGSNASKKIDVRVVAATNAPLMRMIDTKDFRLDLYYRLNVLPINVLPLRNRPEDIPLLAEAFLKNANTQAHTKRILLQSTVDHFKKMPWLGNVRELQNAITYMVIASDEEILNPDILSTKESQAYISSKKNSDYDSFRFKTLNGEKYLIAETLEKSKNISEAARTLKMSRSTLRDKMKMHGLIIQKTQEVEL